MRGRSKHTHSDGRQAEIRGQVQHSVRTAVSHSGCGTIASCCSRAADERPPAQQRQEEMEAAAAAAGKQAARSGGLAGAERQQQEQQISTDPSARSDMRQWRGEEGGIPGPAALTRPDRSPQSDRNPWCSAGSQGRRTQ